MKLTDGENPPKSNESNNCCDPIPVPTNGSKYLTIAGGTLCNTLFTSIELVFDNVIPNEFTLGQNYPNPFNPSTTIDFAITEQGPVNITIYDAVGQAVEELVNDFVPAGAYKIHWDASRLASGVYFYRMEAGNFVQTQKMILLK